MIIFYENEGKMSEDFQKDLGEEIPGEIMEKVEAAVNENFIDLSDKQLV